MEVHLSLGSYRSARRCSTSASRPEVAQGYYKDIDMLPKVNKAKKYLRSCHSVIRAHPVYFIRKTIIVQTCGHYPKYATPDNEKFTRMLHLPPDKNMHFWSIMFGQLKNVQQSMQWTIELFMIYWIRSPRTPICIHTSNSMSPRGMVEGHLMPSTPDG